MKKPGMIPVLLFILLTVLGCKVSPEEPRLEGAGGSDQDKSLKLVEIREQVSGVALTNPRPVRGVQFTVRGAAIAEVRTTDRSEGFLASFNQDNGRVIVTSLSGDEIPPGAGFIAEIVCDKSGAARLSEVKVVP